jgi:hypothetical protein
MTNSPRAASIPARSAFPYPLKAIGTTRAPRLAAIARDPSVLPLSATITSPWILCRFKPVECLGDAGAHCLRLVQARHNDRQLGHFEPGIGICGWLNLHHIIARLRVPPFSWLLDHADKPARIPEEHSETPYTTRRAMAFIDEAVRDGRPWCLHLSYIKLNWPYIAPAPYHAMYRGGDVLPALRTEDERADPHPVYRALMAMRPSRNFSRAEERARVIPTYMGLIKQIDDQLGVLFRFLDERGLTNDTMVVFTSDHGDYLGDHWLGEKDFFHNCAVMPLIVADPRPQGSAARGTVCEALVEAIDLVPTFLEYFGNEAKPHVVEGRSLMPFLRGETPAKWRQCAFSEYDYAMLEVQPGLEPAGRRLPAVYGVRRTLEIHPHDRI